MLRYVVPLSLSTLAFATAAHAEMAPPAQGGAETLVSSSASLPLGTPVELEVILEVEG